MLKKNSIVNRAEQSVIAGWVVKYKWHFLFWICYFIYAFITDSLLYGKYVYFSKELLFFSTHNLFLFYAFLYGLNKFSNESPLTIFHSSLRIVIAISCFWAIRVVLNFRIYPIMDAARGIEKETIVNYQFVINGCFWVTEYFVKALAYFFVIKYVNKERQHRKVLEEKMEQERQLIEKRIEQQQAEQQQKEYEQREAMFINLVHETKTPITLINNYIADHIELHGSSDELEIVKNNVGKLSRDVTNLFDLERFRHGVEMFDHDQRVDFSALLHTACAQFALYSQKKDIRLCGDIGDGVIIAADPVALTRIVNNLVENAIKYSTAGTEIVLTLTATEDCAVLRVADQGPGIDPGNLADIFTPYHLLNKYKKNDQGMGLGLPMVSNIVDSLDGELSIKNGAQRGTVVTVTLPIGADAPLAAITGQEPGLGMIEEREPVGRNLLAEDAPLLLVVEDNADLNSYLVRKLRQHYRVRAAANGADAISQFREEVPDLVISDVMMDHMDGFAFAETLQRTPAWSHVPVIFLTARATEVDKMRGLSLGAIDYIVKPFAVEELLKKAGALLRYTNRQEQRLIEDLYHTAKQMKRKGHYSQPDELPLEPATGVFETKCRDAGLTKREVEITRLLIEGKTNKFIAETIFISPRTVETHIRNVYEKLQVSNKVALLKQLQ
ncbi:signal transduction histidine kinase [Taibaiella chishuiensis]|uniref:histidine kinase n=1 Tax=Taibaiella chishuiensis TaxID=1434707 RepID=A0A2P8D0A9_9BACT|nr:signal transduction histidine kinase [Taibaiella chishuiensis]